MHDDSGSDDTPLEQPSTADAESQSALPEGFQTDGEAVVAGLQALIEGKSVLAVASALTATIYAAVTQSTLDQPSKEALSVMVADLAMNVLAANEISGERLSTIMDQRGGIEVHASALGAVLLEQAAEPEQG